jgi:hypothetical protein
MPFKNALGCADALVTAIANEMVDHYFWGGDYRRKVIQAHKATMLALNLDGYWAANRLLARAAKLFRSKVRYSSLYRKWRAGKYLG